MRRNRFGVSEGLTLELRLSTLRAHSLRSFRR
jgi:hypothetical protein